MGMISVTDYYEQYSLFHVNLNLLLMLSLLLFRHVQPTESGLNFILTSSHASM
jgi:hypothetical protein